MNILRLPSGFKRDYAVGISSNPYILHLNYDCIYLQNDIQKKINILKKQRIDCLYSKYLITYNVKNRKFGKIDNYKSEACLFHTRDFWKTKGFEWSDMHNEGDKFYYGHGVSRLHYKESIVLLITNHNHNTYNIESNSTIQTNYKHLNIPNIVYEINNKKYALQTEMNDLFYKKNLDIVCINCESVIDKNLKKNNIEYLEYPKNTTNEKKIKSDLLKLINIDMIIFNTIHIFKNIINEIKPKYVALINKKTEYIEGYNFYNNIYIRNN